MRIRVIGSGTLIPDSERGSPSHWIEADRFRMLVDCGSGTLRTMARLRLAWQRITHVVITHFHTDHVADLAPLLFALRNGLTIPREDPLFLLGPRGLQGHLNALAEAHGQNIVELGFPLEIFELSPGQEWAHPEGDLLLRTTATRHTENSLGVRVETADGSVGFTGDTGPDPRLGPFFRGCRLLVAECSHPEGSEMDTHLTPPELAELAGSASPELLVAVHCYPSLAPDEVPGLLAQAGYQGRALTGWDGLGLDLTSGGIEVV
jgi:ribonuclease BN (tRNA processing enzyme)